MRKTHAKKKDLLVQNMNIPVGILCIIHSTNYKAFQTIFSRVYTLDINVGYILIRYFGNSPGIPEFNYSNQFTYKNGIAYIIKRVSKQNLFKIKLI